MSNETTQFDPRVIMPPGRFAALEEKMEETERLACVGGLLAQGATRILDVGGARGKFLADLAARTQRTLKLVNVDVSDYYADKQLHPGIEFVCGSILDAKFEEASFDIVTFRHVLHHLVAPSLRVTLQNQQRALERMCRLLRPGGRLVFEEQFNNIRLFSRLVYQVSKWASRQGLVFKSFDTGGVIVSFMTPGEIAAVLDALAPQLGIAVEQVSCKPWPVSLRWKLTLLMCSIGSVFYVVKRM
jgi:SAM-dependent methyltransferase